MKNRFNSWRIIAFALAIAFTMAACEDEVNPDPDPYTPSSPQPGDSASDPINRVENINLGTMTTAGSGWLQLLDSIWTARKYVNLDLSACTMSGTEFNPRTSLGVGGGKLYIVSLILPTAATSIAAGTATEAAFGSSRDLKSISGANITEIGDNAFADLKSLQSVDFPKATSIGSSAFAGCSKLQSVTFPQATSIDWRAFSGCTSLQSVNLPRVTNIDAQVFSGDITTPLVITMGSTAPTLGGSIVLGRTGTVTVKVPANATGYSPFTGTTAVTVSGASTEVNWANGLRGGGWTGSTWAAPATGIYNINKDISLTIQQQ